MISTKGAPWSGLEREGCGWWVDHGVDALATALRAAMAMSPDALGSMGLRGRKWMTRDFAWDRVARDMLDVYSWISAKAKIRRRPCDSSSRNEHTLD